MLPQPAVRPARAAVPAPHDRPAPRLPGDVLLVLLFACVIALPLVANAFGHDGGDAEAENRELAPRPRIERSWASLIALPSGFNNWFQDHFGFRASLVRWYGESRYFVLGVSPSSSVIAGRDGWLFYADDGGVADYTNEKPLSADELEAWIDTLERTRDWLARRGIAYVVTIPPDKHVIYPEEVPGSIHRIHDVSRMDQVLRAIAENTHVSSVDVRPALMAARQRELVYDVTDTHWNARGAFVAYQQIIAAVRKQDPAVPLAWTRDDFAPTEDVVPAGDLAGMMGLKRVMTEHALDLRPRRPRHARVIDPTGADPTAEEGRLVTEIPGSTLPRAVIFRDSFASRLAPFLSEHFSRAVYLWENDFDPDVIQQEHPDVVIQEIVGRHLYTFQPTPELVPK